jgi:FkbM family methyltransferase
VFLDCGGNDGCSVRKFRRLYDRRERFHVYSFEPNPQYRHRYDGLRNHTLVPAAVDDREGVADFYLDREDGDGSTLFKEKLGRDEGGWGVLDRETPIQVETIDLSAWIRKHLPPDAHVVLKLDIEGAEYNVLEKMALDGTLAPIRHLLVEWHWNRVGVLRERHDRVVRLLAEAGVPWEPWDAREIARDGTVGWVEGELARWLPWPVQERLRWRFGWPTPP